MPKKRVNTLQAVIDHLVDSGVSDFNANMFIHTNILALGDGKESNVNIVDAIRADRWDDVWNVIDLYISGDLW